MYVGRTRCSAPFRSGTTTRPADCTRRATTTPTSPWQRDRRRRPSPSRRRATAASPPRPRSRAPPDETRPLPTSSRQRRCRSPASPVTVVSSRRCAAPRPGVDVRAERRRPNLAAVGDMRSETIRQVPVDDPQQVTRVRNRIDSTRPPRCANGYVVECRICNRKVAGSNLGRATSHRGILSLPSLRGW